LGQCLAVLDPPTGHRPGALGWAAATPDQQDPVVVDHDRPDSEDRTLGHPWGGGSGRCTVIALATRPKDSKKFLVCLSPGSARLSTPKQPRSVHQSISACMTISPMPTSRQPGSV